MNRLWMEVAVCRWWKIGLLSVLCLAGWSGWVKADSLGLSFEARVTCQRSIEEVYWKHTIWPEENTSPKPPLSEVIFEDELRKKVEETLRMSKALEVIWKQPVDGYQLQAEMERMAETTRNPEILRELWSALGNDLQLIAECLARPLLMERLNTRIEDMKGMGGECREVEWRKGTNLGEEATENRSGDVLELSEDEWQEAIGKLAEAFWRGGTGYTVASCKRITGVWGEVLCDGGIEERVRSSKGSRC
ncbi:MAG: hypothetical protein DYG83_06750 [Candidatus Brocadia sp. AMX2]|nr:MAG: hypothetical protein EDM70_00600 [Candidatus Brocadia sp. AMX2]KXK28348.1 MAG: hypothetical protein UZ01_02740 [Candidatus Brocadia sinica]MBC6931364.1 hypothetical protein [Candidatus Brocadia sp.]MBL1168711.1 hypothetical protein [Candidatus Brocadia sp. AMX1]MCE7866518.1 hypothetical protein [Candidatus Brocadia sp. AMX2]